MELKLCGAGDEVLFYIWVKLSSETPDSRTDGFLKMRLFPGTGEYPVSKGQLFTMVSLFNDGNFTWEEGED